LSVIAVLIMGRYKKSMQWCYKLFLHQWIFRDAREYIAQKQNCLIVW